jgi:hypothetical protein
MEDQLQTDDKILMASEAQHLQLPAQTNTTLEHVDQLKMTS